MKRHNFIFRTFSVVLLSFFISVQFLGASYFSIKVEAEGIDTSVFVKISAGSQHSLGLKSDGSLWTWGQNWKGELGDGTYTECYSPKQIISSGVVVIAAGDSFSLALKSDGSLWAWGYNYYGQLGDGTTTNINAPKLIISSGVCAISAGGYHSLAIKSDGSVWAWGENGYGQLGDGTTTTITTPKQIITSGVTAISAGGYHSLAIKSDGSVWAWGANYNGQLGDETTTDSLIPKQIISSEVIAISVGSQHSLVVKSDGSLWAWGNNYRGQLGDGTTINKNTPKQIISSGVTTISAGSSHSLAVKSDGSLWAWGFNWDGKLGDGTTTSSSVPKQILASGVTAISAGGMHTLALKIDDSLWAWGDNSFGQLGNATKIDYYFPKQIISSGITAISAGDYHSLAIKSDGSLWAWGENGTGQLGDGTTTNSSSLKQIISSGITAISTGGYHSLALKSDGSLWAWGDNSFGQLGDGTTTNSTTPKQIIASGVTAISAGGYHSLALKSDGSLWAWGENGTCQLGDGSTINRASPNQIISSGVTAISAGGFHSLAIKSDSSLWAWGNNEYGQIGDGTYISKATPNQIISSGITAISAGDNHSLAIKDDGSVWAWGDNSFGQLGDGKYINRTTPKQIISSGVTAISAGSEHSFALKSDDSVWAWGANYNGQLGDETTTDSLIPKQIISSEVIAISVGHQHSLAVKSDGSLWAWGNNYRGQLGDGSNNRIPNIVLTDIAKIQQNTNSYALISGNKGKFELAFTPLDFDNSETQWKIKSMEGNDFVVFSPLNGVFEAHETGNATIQVTNLAENIIYKEFIISVWSNTSYLGVENNKIYNTERTIILDGVTATLNGNNYVSGTVINNDGKYNLVLNNNFGNAMSICFIIDKTAPNTPAFLPDKTTATNTDVSVTIIYPDDATVKQYKIGSGSWTDYTTPITVSSNTTVYAKCKDSAENWSAENSFIINNIDKTPPITPTLTPDKTTPINTDVTVYIAYPDDVILKQYKIGLGDWTSYSTPLAISSNTTVYAKCQDFAGNWSSESSLIVTNIDKTPPVVTGVENNKVYNTSRTISFNEGSAILNDNSFTKGSSVSNEGYYTLIVTDSAGNFTTITFSIDKTPPTFIGIEYGKAYKEDKKAYFEEGTATLNGNNYLSGTNITDEGSYVFILTDTAGNTTTANFAIDKTVPIVSGIENNIIYTTTRTISFNEGTATLNGNSFTKGSSVSIEGDYTLIVTDTAGNVTTITFSIDKTPPTVIGIETGKAYKDVKKAYFEEGTATLNGNVYLSGTNITDEGSYVFILTDIAGNETTINFLIDKTPPVVTGVENNITYNTTRTISFNEGTATLNGNSFTKGSSVSIEGDYTLIVTDTAGNVTTITFSIDKTPPTVTGVVNNVVYNSNVTITFSDGTATLNESEFKNGDTIKRDGFYTLVVTDIAGNAKTIKFVIDKPFEIIGVVDNEKYNTDITIEFNEGTATLNGNEFISGTTITEEGQYTLSCKDNSENTTIINFIIDKTAPSEPSILPNKSTSTNTDVTVTVTYPADATVKQYKIGTGEWTNYSAPFAVSSNSTVYAKCQDIAGNWSSESSIVINNIDKTAPNTSTLNPDKTTATNTDVIVTVTYPADANVKQYKIGTGAWTDYTAPFAVSSNTTVYAKCQDIAGNWSSEGRLVISNIDKTPPLDPSISPDKTTPTNTDVTITITYPSDAEYKLYRINEGSWQNYTAPVVVPSNCTIYAQAQDNAGNWSGEVSCVVANIDKVAPQITIENYKTAPTVGEITVNASTNEGTLNQTSHIFTENGSFTFIAVDEAGNETRQTVSIQNIYKNGDVNDDGDINAIDLLLIKKFILKQITLTDEQKNQSDMNNDGKINVIDLLIIRKIILGK